MCERERERGKREKGRGRGRETERQRDRKTERQRDREKERERERERGREGEGDRERERGCELHREAERALREEEPPAVDRMRVSIQRAGPAGEATDRMDAAAPGSALNKSEARRAPRRLGFDMRSRKCGAVKFRAQR